MTELIRENVRERGGTMDPLSCVMDRDEFHWRCLANVRLKGQVYALTVQITCDAGTGECLSEPASIILKH